MTDKEIFDRVLTIGPDINDQGGMASVLQLYRRELPAFHYLCSNSRYGTIAGLFSLATLMCRLPFARLKGRRILHVHTADGKSFVRKSWIMSWGRLWGYKTIYHCHAGGTKDYFNRRGMGKIRRILKKCDASIVLSQSWKEYFSTEVGLDHLHVLNNIVEPADLSGKQYGAMPIRLLFMGTVTDNKGIFDLIDTIGANAGAWRGHIHLTVGGAGDTARLHRMVAQYGIGDMVSYAGWLTGDAKRKAFAAADIAILPSYYEGLPIFLLEAMANAMPVIATEVGGIPEIVSKDNGFLTAPGNKAGLAEAISHYIENPDVIKIHGSNSLSKVGPYLPENVVKDLCNIYRSIMP